MEKLYDLPDLKQLQEWKTYDQKGYRALIKMISKNKKILILATKNSGKNTIQHSVVNYIHRMHSEILVIPSLEGINLPKMKANKKVTQLKKMCKDQKSYIACIQHEGDWEMPVSEFVTEFSGWFECVLDLRFYEGQRILCAIYDGKKSYKCIYKHEFVRTNRVAA